MTTYNESASNSFAVSQNAASLQVQSILRSGGAGDIFTQFADFGSTVLEEISADSIGSGATNDPRGISSDGTDAYVWIAETTTTTHKMYKLNGFSSGIQSSFTTDAVSSGNSPAGMHFDTNTYYVVSISDKAYENSGFTSTVNDSFATASFDTDPGEIFKAKDHFLLIGEQNDAIYELAGFSTTVLDSIGTPAITMRGVIYDGARNIISGVISGGFGKLFERTGFTTTVSDSFTDSDGLPTSLSFNAPAAAGFLDASASNSFAAGQSNAVELYKPASNSFAAGQSVGLSMIYDRSASNSVSFTTDIDALLVPSILVGGQQFKRFYQIEDFSNTVYQQVSADSIGGATAGLNNVQGVASDGTDAYIYLDEGSPANTHKIYKLDGLTAVVLDSFSTLGVTSGDLITGMDFRTNTYFAETTTDKIYETSGFSSTINDSITVTSLDTTPWDLQKVIGATYFLGSSSDKIYQLRGFSTTADDSLATVAASNDRGFYFEGSRHFFSTTGPAKMYERTGFTTSISDSFTATFDNIPVAISRPEPTTLTINNETASSTANIIQGFDAFGTPIPYVQLIASREGTSSVSFAGTATAVTERLGIASNQFQVNVVAAGAVPKAEHFITFSQEAISSIKNVSATSTFGLGSTTFTDVPVGFETESEITFNDALSQAGSIFNRSITSTVGISQLAARTYEKSASSSIAFSDEAYIEQFASNAITFSNTASADVAKNGPNQITFDQDIDLAGSIWNRGGSSNLTFRSVAAAYLETAIGYNPIDVGPEVGCLVKPDPTITLTDRGTIIFDYNGEQVELKNPQFGNIDRVDSRIKQRRTRGNKLIQYRHCIWPKDRQFDISFKSLSRADKERLQVFLNACLGRMIQYLDHEGRYWHGVILTPEAGFIEEREDYWNVSLTLDVEKGTRQYTENARQAITFDNAVEEFSWKANNSLGFDQQLVRQVPLFGQNQINVGGNGGAIVENPPEELYMLINAGWQKIPAQNAYKQEVVVVGPRTTPSTGFRQFAMHFPGDSSNTKYLDATGNNPSAPDTTWSWTGWVRPDDITGRQTLATYWNGSQQGWLIESNSGQIRAFFDGGSAIHNGVSITAGIWNFVAVVWNNGTWDSYRGINYYAGLATSTSSPGAYAPTYGTSLYTLGGDALTSFTGELDGRLAECGYWDKALSASEIDTIFNNGLGTQYSDFSAGFKSTGQLIAYHGLQDASSGAVDEHSTHDLSETGSGTITYRDFGPAYP